MSSACSGPLALSCPSLLSAMDRMDSIHLIFTLAICKAMCKAVKPDDVQPLYIQ